MPQTSNPSEVSKTHRAQVKGASRSVRWTSPRPRPIRRTLPAPFCWRLRSWRRIASNAQTPMWLICLSLSCKHADANTLWNQELLFHHSRRPRSLILRARQPEFFRRRLMADNASYLFDVIKVPLLFERAEWDFLSKRSRCDGFYLLPLTETPEQYIQIITLHVCLVTLLCSDFSYHFQLNYLPCLDGRSHAQMILNPFQHQYGWQLQLLMKWQNDKVP